MVYNLAEKGISIVLFPLLAAKLSPDNYGTIDLLSIVVSAAVMVGGMELFQSLMRFYPDENNDEQARLMVGHALTYSIAGCCITGIVVYVLIRFLHVGITPNNILIYIALSVPVQSTCSILVTLLRVKLFVASVVISSLVKIIINALLAILFLYYFSMGLEGYFLAVLVSSLFQAAVLFWACRKFISFKGSYGNYRKMRAFSLPLIFSSLAILLAQQFDRMFTGVILGAGALGLLATAFRFSSLIGLVCTSITSSVTPLIYQNYKNENTPVEIASLFRYYIVSCMLASIALGAAAYLFISMLLPADYHSAACLVSLASTVAFLRQAYIFFPGLALNYKTKLLALLQTISVVINLLIAVPMCKEWGIRGVLLATLVSQVCILIIEIILSQKLYKINLSWISIIFCFAIFMGITVYLSFANKFYIWHYFISFAITALVAIILRVVTLQELKCVYCKIRKVFRSKLSLS